MVIVNSSALCHRALWQQTDRANINKGDSSVKAEASRNKEKTHCHVNPLWTSSTEDTLHETDDP